MQIKRTYGTSHRTLSFLINSFNVHGRPAGYWTWAVAVVIIFFINLARYALSSLEQTKYTKKFERVRSDYVWMRWTAREKDAKPPSHCALLCKASCCCSNRGHIFHWGECRPLPSRLLNFFGKCRDLDPDAMSQTWFRSIKALVGNGFSIQTFLNMTV